MIARNAGGQDCRPVHGPPAGAGASFPRRSRGPYIGTNADVDAWQKSGLDAMKHAGLMADDSSKFVELGTLTFSRNWIKWGTRMTLEDV
jgi:hypothetical protein